MLEMREGRAKKSSSPTKMGETADNDDGMEDGASGRGEGVEYGVDLEGRRPFLLLPVRRCVVAVLVVVVLVMRRQKKRKGDVAGD